MAGVPVPPGDGVVAGEPAGEGVVAGLPAGDGVVAGEPAGEGVRAAGEPAGDGVVAGLPAGEGVRAAGEGVRAAGEPAGDGVVAGLPAGEGVRAAGEPAGDGVVAGLPAGEGVRAAGEPAGEGVVAGLPAGDGVVPPPGVVTGAGVVAGGACPHAASSGIISAAPSASALRRLKPANVLVSDENIAMKSFPASASHVLCVSAVEPGTERRGMSRPVQRDTGRALGAQCDPIAHAQQQSDHTLEKRIQWQIRGDVR
ncbi:MAG: hypothetical protein MUD01_11785 [Chloroflexaceae bacterium]|nr:hypothetical protein [Chloroflexaceae bacterium]